MDLPNSFNVDLGTAWARWQLALDGAGWHPAVLAAAEGGVALLGLVVARTAAAPTLWQRSAQVLFGLALNTLLRLDQLAVEVARAMARAGDWYGERRTVQALVLLALAALAWQACKPGRQPSPPGLRVWAAGKARRASPESEPWVRTGMALLLAVTVLRLVSLHATDAWLDQRLAGLSLGRLLEGLGLALVGLRAGWRLHADRG